MTDPTPEAEPVAPTREPAEAFHPSEFIADELKARGWDLQELAMRMHWTEIAKSILALELYEAAGTDAEMATSCRLGEMAAQLDAAFGTPGLFANLEAAYLKHRGVEPARKDPA